MEVDGHYIACNEGICGSRVATVEYGVFGGLSSNSGGESMAWKLYHRAAVVATNHTFDEPKHLDSNSFVLSMLRVAMCVSYTRVVEVIPR
jgi:hypothetical protein